METDNLDDIYRLAPMQAGMLFQCLKENGVNLYLRQWSCRIKGKVDVSIFEQAWQHMAERHTMLRTSFHWEGLDKPVQVVHRKVPIPWEFHDWSGIASAEQEEKVVDALAIQRRADFRLSQPPLMRIMLIRTGAESYIFIWTYHHLIMDAWSRSLLFKEILVVYQALSNQQNLTLAKIRPYKDYIIWLKHQDYARAEAFWKQYFEGYDAPSLDRELETVKDGRQDNRHEIQQVNIPPEMSEDLRNLMRRHGLTLGTLFQGIWALILSYYYGRQDLVFGLVVLGRPADLRDSDSIVGPFINTAPMRVRIFRERPMVSWLNDLQMKRAELSQYEYCSLVDVQRWGGFRHGRRLFDTILNINRPPDENLPPGGLSVQDINFEEGHPFPLIFQVVLGKEILLSMPYDRSYFSPHVITGMLDTARSVSAQILQNPDIEVKEIENISKNAGRLARMIRVEQYRQLRSRKSWTQ